MPRDRYAVWKNRGRSIPIFRLVATVTEVGAAAIRIAPLAGGEDDIAITVNMAALADDVQLGIDRRGMAPLAGKMLLGYVLVVPSAQVRRPRSGVVAGSAGGLAGRGPDRRIGYIPAAEGAMAIRIAASIGGAVPLRTASRQRTPGDFGDGVSVEMPRTGDHRRYDMTFGAGDAVGDVPRFHMRRMGADHPLVGLNLAMKPFRRRPGFIVHPAVTMGAESRIWRMATGTETRISGKGVDDTVDMETAPDNGQPRVHHCGMTVGAGQTGVVDMEAVLPEEIRRRDADIMARSAMSLIGGRPNRRIRRIPAGEIAMAVRPDASPCRSVPGRPAAVGETMPGDFGDGIDGQPGTEFEMLGVESEGRNIMAGLAGNTRTQEVSGQVNRMRADGHGRVGSLPPQSRRRRPGLIVHPAVAVGTESGQLAMAVDARYAHLAAVPVVSMTGRAAFDPHQRNDLPMKIGGVLAHPGGRMSIGQSRIDPSVAASRKHHHGDRRDGKSRCWRSKHHGRLPYRSGQSPEP